MPQSKRQSNKTIFTARLRNDIYEKLHEYSDKTGVPMTFAIEKALEQYLPDKITDKPVGMN